MHVLNLRSDLKFRPPSRNGGFSLIELLVVISVIAIIAGIAIPNLANLTQTAGQSTKVHNAQQLVSTYNTYAEDYYAAYNSYPLQNPNAESAINLLGGTNQANITNSVLGTVNSYALPSLSTNNTALEKVSSIGGQLVYIAE